MPLLKQEQHLMPTPIPAWIRFGRMQDRVSKPALIVALLLIALVLGLIAAVLVFPLDLLGLAAGGD
jgi:hypothetical protein